MRRLYDESSMRSFAKEVDEHVNGLMDHYSWLLLKCFNVEIVDRHDIGMFLKNRMFESGVSRMSLKSNFYGGFKDFAGLMISIARICASVLIPSWLTTHTVIKSGSWICAPINNVLEADRYQRLFGLVDQPFDLSISIKPKIICFRNLIGSRTVAEKLWLLLTLCAILFTGKLSLSRHLLAAFESYCCNDFLLKESTHIKELNLLHYEIDHIRAGIIRKNGGFTVVMQKNTFQNGITGFFLSGDILLTINSLLQKNIYAQYGFFSKILPVGSYFSYLNKSQPLVRRPLEKWRPRAIYIGINLSDHAIINDVFLKNYYTALRWFCDASKEGLPFKFYILHHNSFRGDPTEQKIVDNANVEYLSSEVSIYESVRSADICVSFGSTFIFEHSGNSGQGGFLNPHDLNYQYVPSELKHDVHNFTNQRLFVGYLRDCAHEIYMTGVRIKKLSYSEDFERRFQSAMREINGFPSV